MTVLKARVAGAWQTIGAGAMIPAGGAAGDLLTKNSATNFDAVWGTAIPKLTLTSTTVAALDNVNPALAIGTLAGVNVAHYQTGMQARNNGAVASLNINPYGGQVVIGALDSAQYPAGLMISESTAASNRAQLGLGSGWQIGQDFNGNGTKDLYIWNNAISRIAISIDTTGRIICLGDGGAPVTDVYLAGIQTTSNIATAPRMSSDSNWINVHGKTDLYLDGNTIYFRNAAYGSQGSINGGNLAIPNSINAGLDITAAGAVYQSSWFRCNSNNGVYWQVRNGGIQMTDAVYIRTYNGVGYISNATAGGHAAYLEKWDVWDGNTAWSAATVRIANDYNYTPGQTRCSISFNPAVSSVAPQLAVLGNAGGERFAVLNNPGNAFAPIAASAFPVVSSLRFKEEVDLLNDEETIEKIKRVRGIHFHDRVHPQNVRHDKRFMDVNERWQKFGHKPLTPQSHHISSANHDCDIDPCNGSKLDPCNVAMSFKYGRYGLAAEAIYEILPEMIELDVDRKPEMINVDQVAALALAAVAALSRKIEQLESRIT